MMTELREVIAKEKIDSLALVIFGSPDPDALACSFAMQFILRQLDIKAKIYVEKEISHPNNQMMVNTLDISVTHLKDLPETTSHYAILDYQFRELTSHPECKCLIHLDHHKETPSSALYQNIDISVGSCSTLICDYLKETDIKDNKQFSKIALALAYGIYTDTASLLHANPKDFEALSYLRPYYDADAFEHIVNAKYSAQTMEVIKKAMEFNQVKGTFAYSGIGYISAEYRDSLAIAADYLLMQQGISNVLVFAIVQEETSYVNGCFRTNDSAMDTNKFMQSFVVHGSGGGRKNAGGFQEPLGFFEDSTTKNQDKIWELVRSVIEEKIKTKILLTKVEESKS